MDNGGYFQNISFPDGSSYEGDFSAEGKFEGRGMFVWKNGDRYLGEFETGKPGGGLNNARSQRCCVLLFALQLLFTAVVASWVIVAAAGEGTFNWNFTHDRYKVCCQPSRV